MSIKTERVDSLTKEQKEVKQKIMEELIMVMNINMAENNHIFNHQTLMDLVISCVIMFNRDILSNAFYFSNFNNNWKEIYEAISNDIKKEIERVIESMRKEGKSNLN